MTTPSTARKAGPFTGNGSQNSWAFTFKVFATSDVKVTVADAAGTETVLVLGTDYSVTLNSNQDTSPGGSVTYLLANGGKLTVTGDLDYDQPLDIPGGGNFNPVAFENQLDRMVMQTQQLAEEMGRAVKVPVTEEATGQLSTDLADGILALSPIVADIETVAANVAAIDDVSTNMEDVAVVGSNISNVSTVAGISGNVTSVAGNATNINAVAAKTTQITAVAAIDDEVAAVAGNATNINTVAGIAANVTTVAGIAANVTSVAGNATNINVVAGNNASITAVAGAAADIAVVADNLADVSNFADVYQGSKTSNPTLRNDGSALQLGDLYFNSVNDTMRAYGAGGWADAASATPVTITPQAFSGNGSTTAFTLSVAPAFEAACDVYISGVFQVVDVDYNISGTTLTFTSAPPPGTGNINVKILSSYAAGVPANGSVNTAALADGAVTAAKLAPGAATLTTKLLRFKYLNVSGTYTPPSDISAFYVQVYGATGGANGANKGGVGGPGYSEKYYSAPSGSYTYAIGAAGSTSGTAGGTTTFGGAITVTGSVGATTSTGASGGSAAGGDFSANGGSGGNYSGTAGGYGGCGGAGSRAGVGGNGGVGFLSVPGGQGGTGGNNASGIGTDGVGATAVSGSALVMPWGGASEVFYGGRPFGLNGIAAIGAPALNNDLGAKYGYQLAQTYSLPLVAPVLAPTGNFFVPYPFARYSNTATDGMPALIVIIEVLK